MPDLFDVSMKPDPPRQLVTIVDIDVPMGRIAVFMLKWAIVSLFFAGVAWAFVWLLQQK